MNVARLADLRSKAFASYVTPVDLRDLAFLCESARHLRQLVDGILRLAENLTINDERTRLLALLEGIALVDDEVQP